MQTESLSSIALTPDTLSQLDLLKILSTSISSVEFSDGIEIVFDEQLDLSPI